MDTDKAIEDMTDREIMVETLTLLRAGRDAVESALSNPMLGGMLGMMPAPSNGDNFEAVLRARGL